MSTQIHRLEPQATVGGTSPRLLRLAERHEYLGAAAILGLITCLWFWPLLTGDQIGQSFALHRFVPWAHRKYGDVYTVRLMPKGRPMIFFTKTEHAKEIFAGDPEIFHAGKGNAILGPIMGEHSLLLQDSAEHKRARKLMIPAFNGLGDYDSQYRPQLRTLQLPVRTPWDLGADELTGVLVPAGTNLSSL